jgi:hypothetical protein
MQQVMLRKHMLKTLTISDKPAHSDMAWLGLPLTYLEQDLTRNSIIAGHGFDIS